MAQMPETLRLFLEQLDWQEADLIAEWLDETNEAAVEMNAVIMQARKGHRYGAR